MPAFAVFLPVYNEEEILKPNMERLLAYLSGLGPDFEILIGSNGSTDGTVRLGEELARRDARVRFFSEPRRGPGAALRTAVGLMRHDLLICLDMDLSTDLGFVPEALRLLESSDVVIGSKCLGRDHRSFVRRLGSGLFIAASRLLLNLPFDDYSIGAKAYRKAVLERYLDAIDRWTAYVQEIVFLALRDGLAVVSVPVQCEDFRRSRFRLPREALYRFGELLRFWWSVSGGRVAIKNTGTSSR
jgi:glycosyltransferase involved in cell wall biosynthesis